MSVRHPSSSSRFAIKTIKAIPNKPGKMAEGGRGEEKLELLRRAIDEVDALQAIYGDDSHDDKDAVSSFRVVSRRR